MLTVKEMHAGDGYAYLLRGVADAAPAQGPMSQMTRYYATDGNPPGVWMGAGLAGLDAGRGLAAGSTVSSDQMERLFRDGLDPVSGGVLGRRNRIRVPLQDRVTARVAALGERLAPDDRAAAIQQIEAEEAARRQPKSVAGFDFTFTAPKSVSTLWALADSGVREQLYQAHRQAVADVVAHFESEVARTRIGTNGVARVPVRGVVAAAFDHWDSRNGDPHLHTHVVVANRVQAADGRWRTLDSLGSVFPNVVALSELYNNVLATQVTARLGLDWYQKTNHRTKAATWELCGVSQRLLRVFSSRRAEIQQARTSLAEEAAGSHTSKAGRELDRRAWRATRKAKTIVPLSDLLSRWRQQATRVLGRDPVEWATELAQRGARARESRSIPMVRADDLEVGNGVERLARTALSELGSSRSTWTVSNIRAAVARATMHVRLASTVDILAVVAAATSRVQDLSVDLTPNLTAHTPDQFQLSDGSSAFTRPDVYTSQELLDAEERLIADANRLTAPALDLGTIERYANAPDQKGVLLADDQVSAAVQVSVSGRGVDVLVGPAGTGKTTTLAKLTAAWQATHGDDSVIGLAPSAAAAHVLAESLGIETENTAKWLHEQGNQAIRLRRAEAHRQVGRHEVADELLAEHRRWAMREGSLVIVDEASLAGTLALDALRAQATTSGAKLLLVGDPYQLSAIEAGGAFGLLVSEREGTAPELNGVWRFRNDWEGGASVQLRFGREDVLDTYAEHGRIHSHDDAVEAAFDAWRADQDEGLVSLLIASDNATVTELNARARHDRVEAGLVDAAGVSLHDGTAAGAGDRIVTRHNDRTLTTGRGWVKNGDTWTVLDAHSDGSLLVQRGGGSTAITLPAAYVADHVELAYATTAHRAQGSTVDTAHVVIDPAHGALTREVLYVAMTRGRQANHVHVDVQADPDPDHAHLAEEVSDARTVLVEILKRRGAALSATQTRESEVEAQTSMGRLVAEYDTIRRWATTDRYANLLRETIPDIEPTHLPEWPQILDALRRLEASGRAPGRIVPEVFRPAVHPSHSAAQLEELAADCPALERRQILGVTVADVSTQDPDIRRALDEREASMRAAAGHVLATELNRGASWTRRLPPRPADAVDQEAWTRAAIELAARRELGAMPGSARSHPEQMVDISGDARVITL